MNEFSMVLEGIGPWTTWLVVLPAIALIVTGVIKILNALRLL